MPGRNTGSPAGEGGRSKGNSKDLQSFAMEMPEPAGEIVEASTSRFIAQCLRKRLHKPPAFGAFVRVLPPGVTLNAIAEVPAELEDPFADLPVMPSSKLSADTPDGTLYALVFAAATGGMDPGRRASAYGLDEVQLESEQPQIFDLLATQFEALHIGHVEAGRLRFGLPAYPPRLHAFVYECAPAEARVLTDAPDLMRRILAAPIGGEADQLISACLRRGYEDRNQDFAFLVRSGKQLARLLSDDPERLAAILRSLEP